MTVNRITDPKAFLHPAVQRLFAKAAAANHIEDIEGAVAEIMESVSSPAIGCFVGTDPERGLVSLAVVFLPYSPFVPHPQMAMIYSADPGAAKPVVEAIMQFCRANGHNRCQGLNFSGKSDKVLQRVFSYVPEVKTVASVMEYNF